MACGQGIMGLRDWGIKGVTQRFWIFNFAPHSRDALTRGFLISGEGGQRTGNREQRAGRANVD